MTPLMDFFFPPRCLLCGDSKALLPNCHLCEACASDLKPNLQACACCGIPLHRQPQTNAKIICGQCLKSPPYFDRSWSAFIYAQPLEWMIQQLKFNAKLAYASLLSELMIRYFPAELLASARPDAVIPMPLHYRRLKQRGFNQSVHLARPVAQSLRLPLDTTSCIRIRDTEHQTGKNARQRNKNIKGAFEFQNTRKYQHLIIFDDVVTTGSSVSELSRTLKRSGVKRVEVWSLARAEKIN